MKSNITRIQDPTKLQNWTSIILAGGQSRRMGQSKALLAMEQGTVIQQIAELLLKHSKQVIIVTNEPDEPFINEIFNAQSRLRIIKDQPPFIGDGPLAGIYSAMSLDIAEEWLFVCACDVVNIDQDYITGLQQLTSLQPSYEAFIPISEGKEQPLVGLYRIQIDTIESLLLQNKRRLKDLLNELNVYYIEQKEWKKWTKVNDPFFNMNTSSDYKAVLDKRRDKCNEYD